MIRPSGVDDVDTTILEPIQVEIPGILEKPSRKYKRSGSWPSPGKLSHCPRLGHRFESARPLPGTRPELSYEPAGLENFLSRVPGFAAGFPGVVTRPRFQLTVFQQHEIAVKRTKGILCPGRLEVLGPDSLRRSCSSIALMISGMVMRSLSSGGAGYLPK